MTSFWRTNAATRRCPVTMDVSRWEPRSATPGRNRTIRQSNRDVTLFQELLDQHQPFFSAHLLLSVHRYADRWPRVAGCQGRLEVEEDEEEPKEEEMVDGLLNEVWNVATAFKDSEEERWRTCGLCFGTRRRGGISTSAGCHDGPCCWVERSCRGIIWSRRAVDSFHGGNWREASGRMRVDSPAAVRNGRRTGTVSRSGCDGGRVVAAAQRPRRIPGRRLFTARWIRWKLRKRPTVVPAERTTVVGGVAVVRSSRRPDAPNSRAASSSMANAAGPIASSHTTSVALRSNFGWNLLVSKAFTI